MILSRIFIIIFLITTILFPKEKYINISYMGINYHPNGSDIAETFPRRWDKNAYLNTSIGTVISYDIYLNKSWFIRNSISLFKDCADVFAGFLHVGFRKDIIHFSKHSLSFGIGPTLVFRENWHKLYEYENNDFFGDRVYKDYQYRLVWYGGDIEYRYQINKNLEFQYAIIPGYPLVISNFFGIRVKI